MATDNDNSAQAAERREKPLNELLTSSMISIYVGQENTHWYIHERLLCYYSPFFADIFYADDKSPEKEKAQRNKAYGLSDEDDLAFEMLVGWLYSRNIKVPMEEKDVGPLLDLYLLSERLEIDKLSTDLVEAVSHFYYQSHTYPSLRRVQHIYSNTNEDNEMREMMVGAIAKLLTTSEKIPAHWASALQRNGQLAVDIIRSIQQWKIEEKTIPDARDRSSSRGRSVKNGFSSIERVNESRDTDLTGSASNLGVESLNSDHDQDSSMHDSQYLKSENSEAFPSPSPNYSPAEPSNLDSPLKPLARSKSSPSFASPDTVSWKFGHNEPKKPPDSVESSWSPRPDSGYGSPVSPTKIRNRRLSVTFADEIQYSNYPSAEDRYAAYTFFRPPLATVSRSELGGRADGIGLGLNPLPTQSLAAAVTTPVSHLQPEGFDDDQKAQLRSAEVQNDADAPIPSTKKNMVTLLKGENYMLGMLWIIYLGWMARA